MKVSCLFREMGKILGYFMTWAIHRLGVTYIYDVALAICMKICCDDYFSIALLKAQICMISFQTCTQIFGIHKALIHVMR